MGLKLGATLVLLTLLAVPGAATVDPARAFLTNAFHLSTADIERLDTGQVVSRTLEVKNRREVATLGIIRIRTSASTYVERLADITTFKRMPDVLQIGTFRDLSAVARRRGAEHRRRRSEAAPRVPRRRLRRASRRGRHRAHPARDRLARARRIAARRATWCGRLLVDYVAGYRRRGSPRRWNMRIARRGSMSGASSRRSSTRTRSPRPTRRACVGICSSIRNASTDKLTDFVYWSKELVRGRPVISITHVATATAIDDSPVAYAIGSKQIYAMHYYDASLGVTLLVPDRTAASPATYVVYLNRSRIDIFDGLFGGVARRIVAGRARTLVAEQLQRLQRVLATPSSQEPTARNR